MAKQKASSEKSERWSCDICMIPNEKTADKCAACEAPNPKAPAKTEAVSKSSFVFGVSQPETETPKATTSSAPSSGGFGDLLTKEKAAAATKWTRDIYLKSSRNRLQNSHLVFHQVKHLLPLPLLLVLVLCLLQRKKLQLLH